MPNNTFAIVTEPFDAMHYTPFEAQFRKQYSFKRIAYYAVWLIHSSIYLHPTLGFRFKPFEIYDAYGVLLIDVSANGRVRWDTIVDGLPVKNEIKYIVAAITAAIEEACRSVRRN